MMNATIKTPFDYSPQFRRLIYDLLYPGVLGSMIFDLFDPLRGRTFIQWSLVLIALLFLVDYLHLRFNLRANRDKNARPLIDGTIAMSYCAGYFSLSAATNKDLIVFFHTYSAASLFFICFTLLLAAYYQLPMREKRGVDVGLLVPILISVVGAFCMFFTTGDAKAELGLTSPSLHVFVFILLICFTYGWYVRSFGQQVRQKPVELPEPPRGFRWLDRAAFIAFFSILVYWVAVLAPQPPDSSNRKMENGVGP